MTDSELDDFIRELNTAATSSPAVRTYRVMSFSFYADDEKRLRESVKALRERGATRMTMSRLLRELIADFDLDAFLAKHASDRNCPGIAKEDIACLRSE